VTLAAGDSSFAIPTGALEIISLGLSDPSFGGPIELVSYPELLNHRRLNTSTGAPTKAHVLATTVAFSPTSSGAFDIIVEYEGPFTALSGSNASNWILASHPDAYLFGALVESAPYLKDDPRVGTWEGRFQRALAEMEVQRERRRWPANVNVPVPPTLAGAPPRF
jgi:hypothetical protein